jgi:hypothetical protein
VGLLQEDVVLDLVSGKVFPAAVAEELLRREMRVVAANLFARLAEPVDFYVFRLVERVTAHWHGSHRRCTCSSILKVSPQFGSRLRKRA